MGRGKKTEKGSKKTGGNSHSTGYRGVRKTKGSCTYEARIGVVGERIHLGTYDNAEQAATAYDIISLKLHGPKAKTNFDKIKYLDFLPSMGPVELHNLLGVIKHQTQSSFKFDKTESIQDSSSPPPSLNSTGSNNVDANFREALMKLLGSRSSLVRQRRKRKPNKKSSIEERISKTNSPSLDQQTEVQQSIYLSFPNIDMPQQIVMQPTSFLAFDKESRGGQKDSLCWGKVDDYDCLNRDIFNPITTTTFHDDQFQIYGSGSNFNTFNYNNNYAFTCSSVSDWQDPSGVSVFNDQAFGGQQIGGFQESMNETVLYPDAMVPNVLEEFCYPQNGLSTATTATTEDVCFLGDLVQQQSQFTNEFQLNSLKLENELQFINQQLSS